MDLMNKLRIWDLRTFQEMHAYKTNTSVPTSLDISQRGILGIGHGVHATFWSPDALSTKGKQPYMQHFMPGSGCVETLRFRPHEDVCGIGHGKGISSIVIPGSGEPNLDTMEYNTNPHQDSRQQREGEVRALLEKLSPDMIGLDPDVVATIEAGDASLRKERLLDLQEQANAAAASAKPKKQKSKKRGRSKIQTKLRRKQRNVVDEATLKLREARDKEIAEKKQQKASETKQDSLSSTKGQAPAALKRFYQ
eukprot:CAMPEP_0116850732 /NCGR_PEP_ID=MMETSP0418-20121206/16321_1 /TAXON_ID=1158023 /ORGANISM="Astrosyne radiata, Strain 13vi08-1A" /LENGTH=250 /DNA_ID=CAMNT_0004482657 /DNA_START=1 /DNA_END=753 /DNA_ORIENTATION=-